MSGTTSARTSATCATPCRRASIGPGFNDEFGDTYGIIYGFTADGFSQRELRDYVDDVRSKLLLVPDVTKVEMLGAQDERVFVEFSMQRLAGLGIDRSALIAALQAQNVVSPAGVIQTGNEQLLLRVTGAFESEEDLRNINFVAGGRMIRLRDIADIRRGFADPPQPLFRVNGKPAIGLAVAMREGGDVLALGHNVEQAIQTITADLPLGIEPILVADQPHVVEHAISDFTTSLWQAIVIIMAVSFVSLGVRAGLVVAISIPLTLAIVFPIMQLAGIDLQRISLGALIIALGLLVDDAMTTIDVMTSRLAAGDTKEQSASFAYTSRRDGDADRVVRHRRRLRADRLRQEFGRRIHLLDLRRRRRLADRVLDRRGAVRAAARRLAVEDAEAVGQAEPDPRRRSGRMVVGAMRFRWLTIGDHRRLLRRCRAAVAADPAPVLPALGPAGIAGRSAAAAERLDLRHRRHGGAAVEGAVDRSRCRQLEHLCRPRRHPLLPAAGGRTAERLLHPGGGRRQGRRGAQTPADPSGGGAGEPVPRPPFPASRRSVSGRRWAGRSSTASAGRMCRRCATSRCGSPGSSPATRTRRM